MAKFTLHTSEDDLNFVITGITCPLNQYETVSIVNDALNTDLLLTQFIPFSYKEKNFTFSLFKYFDEISAIEYFLIPNTSNFETESSNLHIKSDLFSGVEVDESIKLIKELPKTDYFIILRGEDLHLQQFKIMECLKMVLEFSRIEAIDPEELPSRRNLIF
jgi:hypothetical protein